MKHVCALLIILATLTGCAQTHVLNPPDMGQVTAPGTLHSTKHLSHYGQFTLRALLWWAHLPTPVTIQNGMDLYRLEYWTTKPDGAPALASGLLAAPRAKSWRGVVSYQHGTNVNRHKTPSKPTLSEGVLGAGLFAGGGYLFVAPDYLGLGTSHEVHPYLLAEPAANATVDLLKAAHQFTERLGKPWPDTLFLTGFSQGGHATLAAQRKLEVLGDSRFQVKAAAAISGAYDLANIAFPFALQGGSEAHSLYLAYLTNAYCAAYRQPLESVFAAPYADLVPKLFDGEHKPKAFEKALPRQPRDLFTPSFLSDFEQGRPTWLHKALEENETFRWTPVAPLRLYYGESDADVSPRESIEAAAGFAKRGSAVRAISVGKYRHDESIFQAIPRVRHWLDEMTGP